MDDRGIQTHGIRAYGTYLPAYRLQTDTMKPLWNTKRDLIEHLGVRSKSVLSPFEDTATIAAQAARRALIQGEIDPESLGAIFVGSESHPYAVKPTGTIVQTLLGMQKRELFCADLEFACKAGTAAIQLLMGLVSGALIDRGLAIGADDSQASAEDILDVSTGAGAAAFVIERSSDKTIARINQTLSITQDIPDFWRKEDERFPTHGGRFTGKPAYFDTILRGSTLLMERTQTRPQDYDHVIFHGPNRFFPLAIAKRLGVAPTQLTSLALIEQIGNTYSANSMLGLAYVLDRAAPGDRIFLCSYGSGAGADAYDLTVTEGILSIDRSTYSLQRQLDAQQNLSYERYLLFKNMFTFR